MQNVFDQPVYQDKAYRLSPAVLERLGSDGIDTARLKEYSDQTFVGVSQLRGTLDSALNLDPEQEMEILNRAEVLEITIHALDVEGVAPSRLVN